MPKKLSRVWYSVCSCIPSYHGKIEQIFASELRNKPYLTKIMVSKLNMPIKRIWHYWHLSNHRKHSIYWACSIYVMMMLMIKYLTSPKLDSSILFSIRQIVRTSYFLRSDINEIKQTIT